MDEQTWLLDDFNVDYTGHLSLAGILRFFAKTAAQAPDQQAAQDILDRLALPWTWMMTDLSLAMTRLPALASPLTGATHCLGNDQLHIYRDYSLRDGRGPCVTGRIAWLLVEARSRRPVRTRDYPADLRAILPALAGPRPAMRVRFRLTDAFAPAGDFTADFSHLDMNRHVNHICYINWVQDALWRAFPRPGEMTGFQISWLKEVRLHEKLHFYVRRDGSSYEVLGQKVDGDPCIRSLIQTRPALA
ncbi:acyl-ACP thioesterase domain-containing protein [Peptococcus simiae]|uniref:Acyl-ACP thioesterase domain-containing protein n=1 Tax=Peptococcus simiae TaxID=1643805 RepID=A0ABW9H0V3_9FIRM